MIDDFGSRTIRYLATTLITDGLVVVGLGWLLDLLWSVTFTWHCRHGRTRMRPWALYFASLTV